MTDLTTVKKSGEDLWTHIEAGDWELADRKLQFLVGAWQRARLRGSESAEIATFFDDLRMRLVTEHDVDQTVGPTQLAWMVAGICSVASQSMTPVEVVGSGVESRILFALAEADGLLSTGELAQRIDRSVGATARELPRLRELGLTTQLSAGRQVLNGITAVGRARAAEIGEEWRRQEQEGAGPRSLARPAYDGATPMDAHDVVKPVEPNDARAVLKACV